MERRSALKNMGMVFGYAVATPTLLGLVQSCKERAPMFMYLLMSSLKMYCQKNNKVL